MSRAEHTPDAPGEATVILGIDTALRCTGYGVIAVRGRKLEALDCGIIKNPPKLPHSACLERLSTGIGEVVAAYTPDVASIEGTFYLRNAKTAMILGMARGSVIAPLARHGIPCYEYSPASAKKAVTGHGRADKKHVATILAGMLQLNVTDIPDDSTDALGLAVCHVLTAQSQGGIHLGEPL